MPSRPVPWLSLIVAPFASVPAVALSGLGSSDAGAGWDFVYGLLFGFTIGVPSALAGLVLFGLSAYLLAPVDDALPSGPQSEANPSLPSSGNP